MTSVVMLTNVVAPDKLGGLERYVRELSAQLVKVGVGVTVVSKRTAPDQPDYEVGIDGVHIIRYSPPSKRDPFFAVKYPIVIGAGVRRGLRKATESAASDDVIIHGHFPVPVLPLLIRGRRFIYTFHAPVYKEIASERQGSYRLSSVAERIVIWSMRQVEAWIMRRAARVVTLSRFIRAEGVALSPSVEERAVLVPGGIDLDRFTPSDGPGAFAGEFGGAPIVFCARRMVARTGVEELIDAASIVLSTSPDTHFVIAGDGPRRAAVEAAITKYAIGDRVHLLGRISDEDLVRWYQSATVAVTPTQELEGFGLSTAEAMACGATPLVTPVGANEEVVEGLPELLTTADRSAESIAAGINAILHEFTSSDSARRRRLSDAAKRFGWPSVVDEYLRVYGRFGNDS